MAGKRKPPPRRRGYDTGGLYGGPGISSGSLGQGITSGFNSILGMAKAAKGLSDDDDDKKKAADVTKALGDAPMDVGMRGGGKIKRVAGKPIGKDDGLIPAQRGEYVVRKSAVKKLGTKVLNQVNKGKLPAARMRGR